jgi:hypothetical protein
MLLMAMFLFFHMAQSRSICSSGVFYSQGLPLILPILLKEYPPTQMFYDAVIEWGKCGCDHAVTGVLPRAASSPEERRAGGGRSCPPSAPPYVKAALGPRAASWRRAACNRPIPLCPRLTPPVPCSRLTLSKVS